MGGDTCDKHDGCMSTIREDIHNLDKALAKKEAIVEGFIKATQDYITASRNDLYGKGGLMDRVGNQGAQLMLQWGLIILVLSAVVIKTLRG